MIRLASTVLLAAALLPAAPSSSTPAQPPSATADDLTLGEVSPSVVMARNAQGSNSTCIALDDGLVFVDAGLDTEKARRFRSAMEARFGRSTQALVLTHAHIDHVFAMAAFADVKVLLAASGRELMQQQVAIEWTEPRIAAYDRIFAGFSEAAKSARMSPPTDWFDAPVRLGPPGRGLVVTTTGGHSSDSSSVWFEAERVLVTGDLVQAARRPYFGDPTTDLVAWIRTLKSWEAIGVAKVCPGHGPVITGAELRPIRTYFQQLVTVLARLRAEGVTFEQAMGHPDLPPGYWPPDQAPPPWWPSCVARAWEQADEAVSAVRSYRADEAGHPAPES